MASTHDAPVPAPVSAPVSPPGGTPRLKFQIRLEDAREVLLDLDETLDFKCGAYQYHGPENHGSRC
jgi:hypothetical protein